MEPADRPGVIEACYVCVNVWCVEAGSLGLKRELEVQLAGGAVEVREYVCLGHCPGAPNMVLYPEGTWYKQVQEGDLPEIIAHIKGGEPVKRLTDRVQPALHRLIVEALERRVQWELELQNERSGGQDDG